MISSERMNEKRLEEIEAKYSTLTVSSEKNGTEYTEVDVEDLVFLIQNGFKQAERVEDLEDKLARIRFVNSFYDKINIRYRKALNNIVKLWITSTWIASTDATDDMRLAHKMSETARKALEGEDYNE